MQKYPFNCFSSLCAVPQGGDVRRQPGRDGRLAGGRPEPGGRVHRGHKARLPDLGHAATEVKERKTISIEKKVNLSEENLAFLSLTPRVTQPKRLSFEEGRFPDTLSLIL